MWHFLASKQPDDVSAKRNEFAWKQCPENLHGNLCCMSSCTKHHCAWQQSVWKCRLVGKLVFKLQMLSDVIGAPDPPLTWSCRITLLPLALHQKQVAWNMSCQYWLLETVNVSVCTRELQRNATMSYNTLPITTAGLYWVTWWSPTQFHIQTVMINMNSHAYQMYLPVLITFFHFSLKFYFISKHFMCFWFTLYTYKGLYNYEITLCVAQSHNIMLCGTIYCTLL
jgi:hypothetical protein